MKILGIESSCDETAAAVVEDGNKLLSNVVASSIDLHKQYGGVVPEIAARSHIESINPVIREALEQAKTDWENVDAIAVTYGPGLGGSLLVGVLAARTLAILKNKPLYAVNHVEAHVYANFLTSTSLPGYKLPKKAPEFPCLALIVSGGHTQLVLFENHFKYQVLGKTLDDAVGEAFDKVAKIIGLPYPGGPNVEKAGEAGDPKTYNFPKPRSTNQAAQIDAMQGSKEKRTNRTSGTESESRTQLTQQSAISSDGVSGSARQQVRAMSGLGKYDFSYSGLKTAVLRAAQAEIGEDYTFPSHMLPDRLSEAQKANIAASFKHKAIEVLTDKTLLAFNEFAPKSVVIAGGVAASKELRRQISDRLPMDVEYTDSKLCTDNAAMIASNGYYQKASGIEPADPYSIDINPSLKM
ncbi:tRNA (adenosine(37)-N6)-threonylcarbamoyltransferase complex transferase subunit TsaD [Candidatus Saccharibacteria bacterium]|nr:tRNA (adenosine(37)-N6)-threonylcarbamoyltransferase complex transferase subunit TsaD [Candidatus Saccharibacteria bacterium]